MRSELVLSIPGQERVARSPFGGRIVIHATAAETDGALGMWETFVPPGGGPAPHMHSRETEVFRVVEGLFRFRCGEQEFDAPAGSVITLPPHVEHSWRNIGETPGRAFGIAVPGGFEAMFMVIAEKGARTVTEIAAIEAEFGISNSATRDLGRG
jgi:mannose-6-phosphate isomerase-like protein (cupin superfamily)